jgi:hypothetical protein
MVWGPRGGGGIVTPIVCDGKGGFLLGAVWAWASLHLCGWIQRRGGTGLIGVDDDEMTPSRD